MGLILRSFTATFVSVFVILFSAMIGMGFAGWIGLKITGPSSTAPTIILTLAIADSIHVLVSIIQSMKKGTPKNDAIVEGLRVNMKPVFLTSLTTVIGFLSLNFSDAPPIHDLGNITAIGVIGAWLLSILFLPAALSIFPMRIKVEENKEHKLLNALSDFVIAKRKPLFALLVLLTGVFYYAMTSIQLNDEFVDYFDTSTKFRRDADHVSEQLTGIYQIEFSLDTKEENGINNPVYLKKLTDFKDWFEAQPQVIHVSSFTDIMKRLNKTMHYDKPEYYTIPEQQDLAAQYLLLYEMSLPFGLDLNNQMNIDKSSTRFTVTLENTSTVRIRELTQQAEQWLVDNAPDLKTEASSPAIMFSHISERNINSMMKGISIALVLITLCLIISLKSLKFGLLSLVPNIVPLVFAFGIWGLTVQQIGFAAAIVASVNIGIVVDDTVHFLTKYVRARTEEGLNPHEATRYAFSTVGVALIATSIILILGFAVLTQSSFLVNNSMGILSVITISAALIADFLFLPPLLILFEEKFSKNN
jgi:predicted RND superfamily exporter protein